jgi:hypothetical protein
LKNNNNFKPTVISGFFVLEAFVYFYLHRKIQTMILIKTLYINLLFIGTVLLVTSVNAQNELHEVDNKQVISDTTFVNLKDYSSDFVYDMKYATE